MHNNLNCSKVFQGQMFYKYMKAAHYDAVLEVNCTEQAAGTEHAEGIYMNMDSVYWFLLNESHFTDIWL